MTTVISIKDISKRYKNGEWGVKNITLDIPKGKMILLAGENGAGKSTLINMLVGLLIPTTGTIHYNKEYLGNREFNNIGFCTQNLSILIGI
ncbi:ABC transporter [Caloranaerobacter azorensis DSM 13643]|uniref:ABC transporter n=1 Tax=Caloranaerobacter azorensis DSM 13643 TaxID=1121264 RepID=A0A1M5QZR8_9FIRM|nr:ATP-binding cassette domain-containing protein [Caloranaerobacter azorensis]SHH19582.1 ABC transporter [Caloranaerobacter azorensis DSM 13643]